MPNNIHGLHFATVKSQKIEIYTQISSIGMPQTCGINFPSNQDLGGYQGDPYAYELRQITGIGAGTIFPGVNGVTWNTTTCNPTSLNNIDMQSKSFSGLNSGETYQLKSTNAQGDVKIYKFYTNPVSNWGTIPQDQGVLYAYQPDTNALEVSLYTLDVTSALRTDITFTDSSSTLANRPIIANGSTQNFESMAWALNPANGGSQPLRYACEISGGASYFGDCSSVGGTNVYQKHTVDLSGAPDGGDWGWEIPDGSGGTTRIKILWNQDWGGIFKIPVTILGCTDAGAFNYNWAATIDDGSCCYVSGCTDPLASNYDATACYDDGSCIQIGAPTDCNSVLAASWINATANTSSSCIGGATGSCVLSIGFDPTFNGLQTFNSCSPTCSNQDLTSDLRWDVKLEEWDTSANTAVSGGYFKSVANISVPTPSLTVGPNDPADPWADDLHTADYKLTYVCVDDDNQGTCSCIQSMALPGTHIGCSLEFDFNISELGNCGGTDVYGCTDSTASNYDSLATIDNGSCLYPVYGCTNLLSSNYNPLATIDDGSCDVVIWGCTDRDSVNYNPLATQDNGSCIPCVYGCTNLASSNYNPLATCDDGSCSGCIYGCTDPLASNFSASATCDDGSCCIDGCTDPTAINYDVLVTCDDGSCEYCEYGCTDPVSSNYNSTATCDDGSCLEGECSDCFKLLNVLYKEANCEGCTEDDYITEKRNLQRFMNLRVMRDMAYECGDTDYIEIMQSEEYGLCSTLLDEHTNEGGNDYKIYGCTNPNSLNYNPSATHPCEKSGVINYCCGDSSSFKYSGCTDPLALNYSPIANIDDGTCMY
tara:strand:+ start:390 stop:2852 length:2463 start_codon:yes stop_codon:yes gene_type:complete